MNHKGTITLSTERLILRPFVLSDAEAAFRNWCSDDAVSYYLSWTTHDNVSITESVIKDWVSNYRYNNYYHWAIEYEGEPIGSIGSTWIDESSACARIGYCIGSPWWNKGITSEAFSAVIVYLLDVVRFNRIEARCDIENQSSRRVMLKCGLHYEGLLIRAERNNRGIVDVYLYSIQRSNCW